METNNRGGSGWALVDLGSGPWARTRTKTEGEKGLENDSRGKARMTEKQKGRETNGRKKEERQKSF